MVDVTRDTAATFDSDMEHSVGRLPPALLAAYPHATDEEARGAQLGSSATSASAGTCGHGRGCKPEPARALPFTTYFDSSRHSRPARCTRVGNYAKNPLASTACPLWLAYRGGMHFLDLKSATMTTW